MKEKTVAKFKIDDEVRCLINKSFIYRVVKVTRNGWVTVTAIRCCDESFISTEKYTERAGIFEKVANA